MQLRARILTAANWVKCIKYKRLPKHTHAERGGRTVTRKSMRTRAGSLHRLRAWQRAGARPRTATRTDTPKCTDNAHAKNGKRSSKRCSHLWKKGSCSLAAAVLATELSSRSGLARSQAPGQRRPRARRSRARGPAGAGRPASSGAGQQQAPGQRQRIGVACTSSWTRHVCPHVCADKRRC